MIFRELTEDEFDRFSENCAQKNYVQTSKMAKLKQRQGNESYLVGMLDNDKIVAATMMFSIKTHFNKYIFYAPRGLLIDYHNLSLLKKFTKELKKFIKQKKGIKLIIDPKEIYRIMDSDGNEISQENKQSFENLKKCGYKHFGFNKDFETIQVRYEAIIDVIGSYEDMLNTFSKSTKKHILDLVNNPIKVRRGNKEDLPIMEKLFSYTAENKHFEHKSLEYYEMMYDIMPELMNIYIAYIDFEYEKNLLDQQVSQAYDELSKIKEEMKKINVGSKMIKKLDLSERRIERLNNMLDINKENYKKYGRILNIGALLSIESGDEYISLTSGMLSEFKNYNPKYAMYNEHIKDAINKRKKMINFYGISGNLDQNSELYKIYELKKGFNPNIVEMIGQFDLPVHCSYYIYRLVSSIKNMFKKIRKI